MLFASGSAGERAVIAYKFLSSGAVSPFSGVVWPPPSGTTPGAWVAASREVWIHGCRPADLPYWIDAELWRVELSDPARPVRHEVQAERARLQGRIDAWGPASRRDFTLQCALRTAGYAAEALREEGFESEARTLSSCETLDDFAAAAEALGRKPLPDRGRRSPERPRRAGGGTGLAGALAVRQVGHRIGRRSTEQAVEERGRPAQDHRHAAAQPGARAELAHDRRAVQQHVPARDGPTDRHRPRSIHRSESGRRATALRVRPAVTQRPGAETADRAVQQEAMPCRRRPQSAPASRS